MDAMILRIDYSNADGTRTAQVLRNDSEGDTWWDVICKDYGKPPKNGYYLCVKLTSAQAVAREWTR